MTPKEILAENYDEIEGICRRLPAGMVLVWPEIGTSFYDTEETTRFAAEVMGTRDEFDKAKEQKLRGQRLVVIVTASETLYQFV